MSDPATAGGNLRQMIELTSPAELGPEKRPDTLDVSTIERKISELTGSKRGEANLILGLVLLWHDHLDESHSISQEIHTPDGSLLHGMMHRREPDYWNSKYWFRKVGPHPAFETLSRKSQKLLAAKPLRNVEAMVLKAGSWNPFGFVDACEKAAAETRPLLRELQRCEFLAVFDQFAEDLLAR